MVVFGIYLEQTAEAVKFVELLKDRTEETGGKVHTFNAGDRVGVAYVNQRTTAPFWIMALIVAGVIGVFVGWQFSWWYLMPAVILSTHIIETNWFWFQILKWGAKRQGYTGKVWRMSTEELVRSLC